MRLKIYHCPKTLYRADFIPYILLICRIKFSGISLPLSLNLNLSNSVADVIRNLRSTSYILSTLCQEAISSFIVISIRNGESVLNLVGSWLFNILLESDPVDVGT